ncbi:MAG TPA: CHAT domain-containing tetratricopeptide repeat protein [Thermoanaerobaculia bacterium]|nr:CHAT domain-containing tetratricopeptide repeat protein [Thermoanaerobaculia bacterium]
MSTVTLRRLSAAKLIAIALLAAGQARAEVVVLAVASDRAAERAGLLAGDRLTGWHRHAEDAVARAQDSPVEGGPLDSPWDLRLLDLVQVPRGGVVLVGTRDGAPREWALSPDTVGLDAGPVLDPELETMLPALGDEAQARAQKWTDLARALEELGRERDAAWAWFEAGLEGARASGAESSGTGFEAARRLLSGRGDLALASLVASEAGFEATLRADWERAGRDLEGALAGSAIPGDPEGSALAAAWIRYRLQILRRLERRYQEAVVEGERAEQSLSTLAPRSTRRAAVLNELASSLQWLERLEQAEALQRGALAIVRPLLGSSGRIAGYLSNLANILLDRGDLAGAETLYLEAVDTVRRTRPGSVVEANLYNNLGTVHQLRGDLVRAETMHRRALALRVRLVPGTPDLATSYQNLALVAIARGDLPTATAMTERTAALYRELLPGTDVLASVLAMEATVRELEGDLDAAAASLAEAAEIFERTLEGSSGHASLLASWGELERRRGDLSKALELQSRALELWRGISPSATGTIETMERLGQLQLDRKDPESARAQLDAALALAQSVAAGPDIESRIRHGLGRALSELGERGAGRGELCAAADLWELQRPRIGGTDRARARTAETALPIYRACADAWLEAGDAVAAFEVLERSRGRAFLEQLARRDLRFIELPPELARRRSLLDKENDRVRAVLRAGDASPDRASDLRKRLVRVRADLVELDVEVASMAGPGISALGASQPLDWPALRRALPPGTTLLSYTVTERETWLLLARADLSAPELRVVELGHDELELRVEALRRAVQRPEPPQARRLERIARELGDALLRPVAEELEEAEQIVIVPDGPLHLVPFAALRLDAGTRPRRLLEIAPLAFASSASVWARLSARPGPSGDQQPRLFAFGDPAIVVGAPELALADLEPGTDTVSADTLSADTVSPAAVSRAARFQPMLRDVRGLPPLPRLASSRDEVLAIARTWGDRARVFVGEEVTEERVRELPQKVGILHLAVHGFTDDHDPLASGLVLSPPPAGTRAGNGILEVWEIFERLRLDADLVTLSACSTALGERFGGEGLLGLTRAFQFAGARSVVASLWAVEDRSTAELMKRFYLELRSGRSKSEALRAAQLALLRGHVHDDETAVDVNAANPSRAIGAVVPARSPWSHPFHWAAFQLYGADE